MRETQQGRIGKKNPYVNTLNDLTFDRTHYLSGNLPDDHLRLIQKSYNETIHLCIFLKPG